jgi:hypothetical protein
MLGQLAEVVLSKMQATRREDIDSCLPLWRYRGSNAIPGTCVVDDSLTGLQECIDERGDFGIPRDIPHDPCARPEVPIASSVVRIGGQQIDAAFQAYFDHDALDLPRDSLWRRFTPAIGTVQRFTAQRRLHSTIPSSSQGRLRLPPKPARTEGPPRTRTRRCINRAKRTTRRGRSTPPRGP